MTPTITSLVLVASLAASAPRPVNTPVSAPIRQSIGRVASNDARARAPRAAALPAAARVPPRRHSALKIIGGAVIGGTIGLFVGGYTGGALENKFWPCHCDDAGLTGSLIGAPVGAAIGAIAGALIAR
jgi:hypothetical protein